MRAVTIYTDGGCQPNPGLGGWGAIVVDDATKETIELYGGERDSTNNRMELTASLVALRSLPERTAVTIFTDSQYQRDGITKWVAGWRKKGWKTADRKDVKNRDLWEALDAECGRHAVIWKWVRGHAGDVYNERADALATQGRRLAVNPRVA